MVAIVLPKLFAKHVHFTLVNSWYLLNKYRHLINWKENSSILEFGFADGMTSYTALKPLLPPDYKEFLATDISNEMLELAKTRVNIPRCQFIPFDVTTENLPSNFESRFDNVFSLMTIHFVKNAKQAFKNIHKMLKPGGETFHVTYTKTQLDDTFHHLHKHPKWGKYGHDVIISPYYYETNPQDSCAKDLKGAGFNTFSFRQDILTYEFPSEETWKENYYAVNPILPNIPREEMEDYIQYYYKVIKEKLFSGEDSLVDNQYPTFKFNSLVISARKD